MRLPVRQAMEALMEQNSWLGFLPLVFILLIASIMVIPFWKICSRTGLTKGLVAVLFVPLFGWMVLIWIIAFSRWPVFPSREGTQ